MKIFEEEGKIPIHMWATDIEKDTFAQAVNLSNLPFAFHHIALMPDVHFGYGMPIGGVLATTDAIIPNAVGKDIGCGMCSVKTNIRDIDECQIKEIIGGLRKSVPVGFNVHQQRQVWGGFNDYQDLARTRGWYTKDVWKRAERSLGTLGGGNHFMEIQRDEEEFIGLMLHSGSRNLGSRLCDYYHALAKNLNEKWHSDISHPDLSFLPVDSDDGRAYLADMEFALAFALENRQRMMEEFKLQVLMCFGGDTQFEDGVNIHHNYAALEHHLGKNVWVHRKGATLARKGTKGIIPGSMGTSSYIVEGLGNLMSFMSCSHGAGRKMGRNDATRNLKLKDCDKSMKGIVFGRWNKCQRGKLRGHWDLGEAPLAYKNIDEVMANQKDLVKIVHKLQPLGVMKG